MQNHFGQNNARRLTKHLLEYAIAMRRADPQFGCNIIDAIVSIRFPTLLELLANQAL
ncbi:hypothetical protein D3C73_1438540 [compost metagenome]